MITATCTTDNCDANGTPYNVIGNPNPVQCGACGNNCELTDLRDDPPLLENFGE